MTQAIRKIKMLTKGNDYHGLHPCACSDMLYVHAMINTRALYHHWHRLARDIHSL